MSGECDKCGEHALECVCIKKEYKGIMTNKSQDHPLLNIFIKYFLDSTKVLIDGDVEVYFSKAEEFTNSWLNENIEMKEEE